MNDSTSEPRSSPLVQINLLSALEGFAALAPMVVAVRRAFEEAGPAREHMARLLREHTPAAQHAHGETADAQHQAEEQRRGEEREILEALQPEPPEIQPAVFRPMAYSYLLEPFENSLRGRVLARQAPDEHGSVLLTFADGALCMPGPAVFHCIEREMARRHALMWSRLGARG